MDRLDTRRLDELLTITTGPRDAFDVDLGTFEGDVVFLGERDRHDLSVTGLVTDQLALLQAFIGKARTLVLRIAAVIATDQPMSFSRHNRRRHHLLGTWAYHFLLPFFVHQNGPIV